MACERDCILEFVNYLKSLDIDVNIGKNKAGGNNGFFKAVRNKYRIDISKNLSESEIIRVLIHEFVHYLHYKSDKTLKSTDFIFNGLYGSYEEDLIKLTVDSIPKMTARELFIQKDDCKKEIDRLINKLAVAFPDVKLSNKNNIIEKSILKTDLKYLLKHDRVRVISPFSRKVYSIENIEKSFSSANPEYINYIKLCSKKRELNRLNSKISRLNRYYNSPAELIARSFEYYILKPDYMCSLTPNLYSYYNALFNLSHENDSVLISAQKIFEKMNSRGKLGVN